MWNKVLTRSFRSVIIKIEIKPKGMTDMNKRSNYETYLILTSLAEGMRGYGNAELAEDADRYESHASKIIIGEDQEQIHDDLIEIFIKMRAALAAYHLQHKQFNIM